jgi:hypothetical protein
MLPGQWINGRAVAGSGEALDIVNPATSAVIDSVRLATAEDAAAGGGGGGGAGPGGGGGPPPPRRELREFAQPPPRLRRWHDLLHEEPLGGAER